MIDNSKNNPSHNENIKIILCNSCAFPNKTKDKKCLYCGEPIAAEPEKSNIIYLKRQKSSNDSIFKRFKSIGEVRYIRKLLYILIALVFLLIGAFLFISALSTHNFTTWIISLVLIIYGSLIVVSIKKGKLSLF